MQCYNSRVSVLEQSVSELQEAAQGKVSERFKNMTAQWPTVALAENVQNAQAHVSPGLAARLGERQNRDHYGTNVGLVPFEQEGRLGQCGLATLNHLVWQDSHHGKPKPGPGLLVSPNVCFLRTELEAVLVRCQSDGMEQAARRARFSRYPWVWPRAVLWSV